MSLQPDSLRDKRYMAPSWDPSKGAGANPGFLRDGKELKATSNSCRVVGKDFKSEEGKYFVLDPKIIQSTNKYLLFYYMWNPVGYFENHLAPFSSFRLISFPLPNTMPYT